MAHGAMHGLARLVVPTTVGPASSPILSLIAFGNPYFYNMCSENFMYALVKRSFKSLLFLSKTCDKANDKAIFIQVCARIAPNTLFFVGSD